MKKVLLSFIFALCGGVAVAQDAVDWAGTYTLVTKDPLLYHETAETYGVELQETYEIEIAKQDGKYVVTKFFGYDLSQSVDGVIDIELDGNKETVCYIPTNRHYLTSKYYEYYENVEATDSTEARTDTISGYEGVVLAGDNFGNDPIKVTRQSDGQIKLGNFVLAYKNTEGVTHLLGWYDKNVPLNGGDPDEAVVAYDWAGTYLVSTDGVLAMVDDVECPEYFLMTIEEDMWEPGSYLVTEFWGHDDLADTNFFTGGLPLTLDTEDGDVCYLSVAPGQNLLAERDAVSYYALTDAFDMGEYPIDLTHNSDDTFTIGMFNINTYGYDADFVPESIAMYFGATAEKGDRETLLAKLENLTAIDQVNAPKVVNETYYDLSGTQHSSLQKGLNFIKRMLSNGQTVTRKVFVK